MTKLSRKSKKVSQADQSKAFIEKAQEIGADAKVDEADEVMRRLARQTRRQVRPIKKD